MYAVYEKADKLATQRAANTKRIKILTRLMKASEVLEKAKAEYAAAEAAYAELAGQSTAVNQSNVGLPEEF